MKKQFSLEEIIRLNKILKRTKNYRSQCRLIKRLAKGTHEYFLEWCGDKEKQRDENGFVILPTAIELVKRYG